jgi:hypothetical protein
METRGEAEGLELLPRLQFGRFTILTGPCASFPLLL